MVNIKISGSIRITLPVNSDNNRILEGTVSSTVSELINSPLEFQKSKDSYYCEFSGSLVGTTTDFGKDDLQVIAKNISLIVRKSFNELAVKNSSPSFSAETPAVFVSLQTIKNDVDGIIKVSTVEEISLSRMGSLMISRQLKKIAKVAVMATLSLCLHACGTEDEENKPDVEIDNSLFQFFINFKNDAADHGIDLNNPKYELRVLKTAGLGEIGGPTVLGTCQVKKLKKNSWAAIKVLKDDSTGPFSDPDNYNRKMRTVLYHEFAHCFLGLYHDTTLGSLMLPRTPNAANESEWQEQLTYLFDPETINRLKNPDF